MESFVYNGLYNFIKINRNMICDILSEYGTIPGVTLHKDDGFFIENSGELIFISSNGFRNNVNSQQDHVIISEDDFISCKTQQVLDIVLNLFKEYKRNVLLKKILD